MYKTPSYSYNELWMLHGSSGKPVGQSFDTKEVWIHSLAAIVRFFRGESISLTDLLKLAGNGDLFRLQLNSTPLLEICTSTETSTVCTERYQHQIYTILHNRSKPCQRNVINLSGLFGYYWHIALDIATPLPNGIKNFTCDTRTTAME